MSLYLIIFVFFFFFNEWINTSTNNLIAANECWDENKPIHKGANDE